MQFPPILRRAAGAALDGVIGVIERAIERAGDPDLHASIGRDRRALRLSHDRLVEALNEIEALEELNATLRACMDARDREIERLERLVDFLRRAYAG